MSIFVGARQIYMALRDDPSSIDAIRAERVTLALAIATDPNYGREITSATVNGQSFTASTAGAMTNLQRLSLLSTICRMDDIGATVSSTTRAVL